MKKLTITLASALALFTFGLALPTQAKANKASAEGTDKSSISVTWGDFNKFRDVRAGSEPRGAFHKRVKKSFEKFFEEYAEELPSGQNLSIGIKDLDLAGDVLPRGTNEIRVMKDLHFPRMEFSYKLTGADGEVIKEGDAKIKDMNYLYHEKTWKRYKEGLYYEKRMFREWFEDTLK